MNSIQNQLPLLTTQQLTVSIKKKIICHQFNFDLFPGEMIGLLGPNGFGKTILLHTLAGLIQPAMGHIFICGKNITTLTPRALARKRALLFQQTTIYFPRNVFEFCLSGRYPHQSAFLNKDHTHSDHTAVEEALSIMELDHKIHQNVQTLSGGELRRLAIATALAQTPRILLLDEPLNHLDPRHQLNLFAHLKQLSQTKKIAILMTLHDPFIFAQRCSKILLPIQDGQFLQGHPRKIITAENLSELYHIPLNVIRSHLCQSVF